MSAEVIWNQVLQRLKEQITEVELRTWFDHVHPLGVENGVLVLSAPTTFAGDWIKRHYSEPIEATLHYLGSETARFEVKVIPSPLVQEDIFTATEESPPKPNKLNVKYTFANFVVGPSNSMAHAASLAVAESPGTAYNPLFIYGGVGLGKTHLMQAVGHYVGQRYSNAVVEYVSTETFTNELINAIRVDKMAEFRDRYRSVDLLLVDDVQFIAGKERTQEEFFHTFNSLYDARKQIILSSDRPPKEILTLETRLRSRFEWGLITDLQSPDLETRMAILKSNAEYKGIDVAKEVIEYIASQVTTNVRELEGALIRAAAYASLGGVELNRKSAVEALAQIFSPTADAYSFEEITHAVCLHFPGISLDDLKSKTRAKEIVLPRQVCMYLIREFTQAPLLEIGSYFGGRDHSTVLHAIQKVAERKAQDAEFRRLLLDVQESLG